MLGREVEIDPAHAALLFIDVQNYTARSDGGEYRGVNPSEMEERYTYFFRRMEDLLRYRTCGSCRAHAGPAALR